MLESAFLFIGTIAFLWTAMTVYAAVFVDPNDPAGDGLAMMGGVVGVVLWGVWTFGTLEIEVASDSTVYTFTHPELTILGVALALVPGYIALTGPIELISRARNGNMDEL